MDFRKVSSRAVNHKTREGREKREQPRGFSCE